MQKILLQVIIEYQRQRISMTKRFCLISLITLVIVCIGCGKSKYENAYDLAIEGLKSEISGAALAAKQDKVPEYQRFNIAFKSPSYQAKLNFLESAGPQVMKNPIVLLSTIHADSRSEEDPNRQGASYSHIIFIEWLDVRTQVTGFYFMMKDGTIQEFSNAITPDSILAIFQYQGGPAKKSLVLFSHTQNIPTDGIFRWSPDLFERVITKRDVQGIGLILKDGSKTDLGPVGYDMQEVSVPVPPENLIRESKQED